MSEVKAVDTRLNDSTVRIVETLACCLAARHQGVIGLAHLMPYLPVSLGLLRAFMERIVDGQSIDASIKDGFAVYEFAAYRGTPQLTGALPLPACLACGRLLPANRTRIWCGRCASSVQNAFGACMAQPANASEALLEHDLLYAAAQHPEPLPAVTLASLSHVRLQQLIPMLERLFLDGLLQQEIDPDTGVLLFRFPAHSYPRSHYQANRTTLRAWAARRPRPRLTATGGIVLGLSLLLATSLGYRMVMGRYASELDKPVTRARAPLPHGQQNAPSAGAASPQAQDRTATPSTEIQVSIGAQGFAPIGMTIAASWSRATALSPTPPPLITREPPYQGSRQLYGSLRLGTTSPKQYPFVLDLRSGGTPVLYFDTNRNGDLTDDAGPLLNTGSGRFASRIHIPFAHLIQEVPFAGPCTLWFFTNDRLWQQEAVAHYTRTQLKGTISIEGREYVAYIADSRENDVDFTNDGLAIDLDHNGKIDRQQEQFRPGAELRLNGKRYTFRVTW